MTNESRPKELPEHALENRRYWDEMAEDWVAAGEKAWQASEPFWGIWGHPERNLRLLPEDMSGLKAIELGCGTAYVSAWLARRGADVVGIDNSEKQLATARRLAAKHALPLTLHHGNAEVVPYPDEFFDFAISEYGAAIWCDPRIWIPEAKRILRPGGELIFLGHSPLSVICMPLSGEPCDERLHRSYFGLHQIDWRHDEVDPGGIEFNLPFSGWLELFRETGLEVVNFYELQAPKGSPDRYQIPGQWAESWPAEQVWRLRRNA